MSPTIPKHLRGLLQNAPLFSALGDETRLVLLIKLADRSHLSITQLSEGTAITRQAITKHLRVLQGVGLVRGIHRGRESLYQLVPKPLEEARESLNLLSQQWDEALARLKSFVENGTNT